VLSPSSSRRLAGSQRFGSRSRARPGRTCSTTPSAAGQAAGTDGNVSSAGVCAASSPAAWGALNAGSPISLAEEPIFPRQVRSRLRYPGEGSPRGRRDSPRSGRLNERGEGCDHEPGSATSSGTTAAKRAYLWAATRGSRRSERSRSRSTRVVKIDGQVVGGPDGERDVIGRLAPTKTAS
jgi:hypothetical protein